MPPLATRPHHPKTDIPKHQEHAHDDRIHHQVQAPLHILPDAPRHPVDAETETKNRKVQRRKVVVQVCDTCHRDKGHVVQEPADDRIYPRIVDLINVTLLEIVVAALPTD